jgi:hypothetical protein
MADLTAADVTSSTPSIPTVPTRTPPPQQPSIGRIVRYTFRVATADEPVERAAIIVNVVDAASGLVNLRVFTDGPTDAPYSEGMYARDIRFDASGTTEQTWRWATDA